MTAPTTHRGRRAKAEAVRQKAIAVLEAIYRDWAPIWYAPRAVEALEAAGLRIVERKSP